MKCKLENRECRGSERMEGEGGAWRGKWEWEQGRKSRKKERLKIRKFRRCANSQICGFAILRNLLANL
jgi:hypothetical protein